jgi:hypothetical protein
MDSFSAQLLMKALLSKAKGTTPLNTMAEMFTMSAMKQAKPKPCSEGRMISIRTQDKGDSRGVSHIVHEVPIDTIKTFLFTIDLIQGTSVVDTFNEQLSAKKDNQTLVMNYLQDVDKLTLGKLQTKTNNYFYFALVDN